MNGLPSLQEQKSFLRKELRQKLQALNPSERAKRSSEILKRLFIHPEFHKAGTILMYVSTASEVETRPAITEAWDKRKKVYLPSLDLSEKRIYMIETLSLEELRPGAYEVLEPPFSSVRAGKPEELDLAIVPGLGFDVRGGRLGRGKGYFDRFLSEAARAYKIGLAFECQMVDQVPQEANDIRLNEILVG